MGGTATAVSARMNETIQPSSHQTLFVSYTIGGGGVGRGVGWVVNKRNTRTYIREYSEIFTYV